MSKQLQGGPLNSTAVSNNEEDNSWVIRYTLNGEPWAPRNGQFYKTFPDGVIRHGYRKQGNGQFHYVWSKPNDKNN